MAEETRGFALTCPHCGEDDTIQLWMRDLNHIYCTACDAEIKADDVRKIIGQWSKLLAWLETGPLYSDEE
jgi:uncharacterized metal-binding protein (TIGR02443 family)